MNATVGHWPSISNVLNSLALPKVLDAKQGNNMYRFLSLWKD